MSDIQCAARFFAVHQLPEAELASAIKYLATQRIAAVAAAETSDALAMAGELATALGGLRVQTIPASTDDPRQALSDFRTAVEEIADGYRGESVLVVTDELQFGSTLPTCFRQLDRAADVVGFDVDGDGWALRTTHP